MAEPRSSMRARDGKRLSAFRTYAFPYMDRPNLTVLTDALVIRLTLEGKRATGVEIVFDGKIQRITAGLEVVLSLDAIHTPKVLMLSGIGDQGELRRLGIPVVQHLPGVGQNFQDHFGIGCVWEYQQPLAPRNNGGEATFFWKSKMKRGGLEPICNSSASLARTALLAQLSAENCCEEDESAVSGTIYHDRET